MPKSSFSKNFALSLGVLAMIFSLSYLVKAWTEPGALPPTPNVPAPINVGTSTQTKMGDLNVMGNFSVNKTFEADGGAAVGTGLNVIGGKVSIGTTTIGTKLYVAGDIGSTVNFDWNKQATANGSAEGGLYFTTTHSGGGNSYTYYEISAPNYAIVSGDYLEYEVYCGLSNPSGICDAGTELDLTSPTGPTAGRILGLLDQSGISNFFGDISSYAKGRWYHRKVSLAPALNMTLNTFDLVEESDTAGSYVNVYRRIIITNGSTLKLNIWSGGSPSVNAVNYANLASAFSVGGSYFAGGYFTGNVGIGKIPSATYKLDVNGMINVNTNKITGVATPTAATDAVNKGYIDLQVLSTQGLVGYQHSQGDCVTAGGTVVSTSVAFSQCRFNLAACPSGWVAYRNWTTTAPHTCNYTLSYASYCNQGGTICTAPNGITTTNHSWQDLAVETASYCKDPCYLDMHCKGACSTCYADITQIGCY